MSGTPFHTTQTYAVEFPGACLPRAGPILRAFVSRKAWGFRRPTIDQQSKVLPIFSIAYPRQYFYEYSAN
jgi:hypothetical protein